MSPFSRVNALAIAVIANVLVAAVANQAHADADQLAYGEHLAQECTTCHRKDGSEKNAGIPPIVGLDPEYFVDTMKFYQTGARTNPAMVSVARSLDEAQLKALAAYLGTLKPKASGSPKSKSK